MWNVGPTAAFVENATEFDYLNLTSLSKHVNAFFKYIISNQAPDWLLT